MFLILILRTINFSRKSYTIFFSSPFVFPMPIFFPFYKSFGKSKHIFRFHESCQEYFFEFVSIILRLLSSFFFARNFKKGFSQKNDTKTFVFTYLHMNLEKVLISKCYVRLTRVRKVVRLITCLQTFTTIDNRGKLAVGQNTKKSNNVVQIYCICSSVDCRMFIFLKIRNR